LEIGYQQALEQLRINTGVWIKTILT
jgi:hypothetical protein